MGYIGDGPKPELEVGDISTKDVTATGDLTVDTNTLFVDASENKVGVGTTSPDTLLNLESAAPTMRLAPTTQNNSASIELGVLNGGTNAYAKIDSHNTTNYDSNIRFFTNAAGSTTQVERMRILSGGGLTFNGDSAQANALDDYEEGSWTPVVAAGWSSPSYAYQNGNYQKVGNVVEAFFFIQFSGTSAGAHVQITGLPFTSVNESGGALRGGALTYFSMPVDSAGMVLAYVFQNATDFRLYAGDDGGASAVSNGNASLAFLIGSVRYRVS